MIELLKTHIKNKHSDKVIQLLQSNPEILELKDANGSSGFMLMAYSGLETIFKEAIELKTSFSFYEAIISGKIEQVRKYLKQSNSAIVNTHSTDGFTPLSLAAFFNQTEIAKTLVDNGADPNIHATNPSKVNALHAAVAKENYKLCELFIKMGIDINAVQTRHVTALHSAVHRGNLDLTQLLIKNGAIIDLKMDNGDTALIIAKREGHKQIEKYLYKNEKSNT